MIFSRPPAGMGIPERYKQAGPLPAVTLYSIWMAVLGPFSPLMRFATADHDRRDIPRRQDSVLGGKLPGRPPIWMTGRATWIAGRSLMHSLSTAIS
jgi:hypothetical protein